MIAFANGVGLTGKYQPSRLSEVVGQQKIVKNLRSFLKAPTSAVFIFTGPSGVGKTAAAWTIAAELGCDPDWGGVTEIPSGTQDGRAVDDLLHSLRLKPLGGSGWKVAIINEADRMTENAEAMWLDGLEHLTQKTVVIFTTNNLHNLSDRFIRRCEVYEFDGSSKGFRAAMERLVKRIWKLETGKVMKTIPEGLGRFEACDDAWSIGLALQQIAPYARSNTDLPERFGVPMIREDNHKANGNGKAVSRASYPVLCRVCKQMIQRGELVKKYPHHHDKKNQWQHANC
jgi:hypothetical protein